MPEDETNSGERKRLDAITNEPEPKSHADLSKPYGEDDHSIIRVGATGS